MIQIVGSSRMDYDKARELEGKMTCRAVARLIGVSKTTVWRWWKRSEPPRQLTIPITLDELGLSRCDGKLCRRCGEPMRIKTAIGICLECETAELAKQGRVKIDG
jgi:hypothetical protein